MKYLLYVGKLEGHEILTFCNRATDPTLPSGCLVFSPIVADTHNSTEQGCYDFILRPAT